MKVYELRPDTYRFQLRGARKRLADTYEDCARYFKEIFQKWLLSEDADSFKDLEELMIMEQFTNLADKPGIKIREEIQVRQGGGSSGPMTGCFLCKQRV